MRNKKIILLVVLFLLGLVFVVQIAFPELPKTLFRKISTFTNHQLVRLLPAVSQNSEPLKRAHVATRTTISFAVIGDYGQAGQGEADVARLVTGWNPDFIISAGDNNYDSGAAKTIDENVGQYYHNYIYPYTGAYGPGAKFNKFFPTLGNHDWITSDASPYKEYFHIPGNKRYYDFIQGPVHFFMLDSDPNEPDGILETSTQALWLKNTLAGSTSPWNIVILHHPPFSSGRHGPTVALQWPFKAWGVDAVLAGHDHTYERLLEDNLPYFVDGLGGATIYEFRVPVPGSQVRYNADFGALRVQASDSTVKFEFINRNGVVIDTFTLGG